MSKAEGGGFEKRGCSIGLFRAMRDLAVERDAAPGAWTIGAVSALLVGNHEIIKAGNRWEGLVNPAATLTHSSESSLIELLQIRHKTEADKHPLLGVCYDGHVSKANVFVSFAYAADFVELVDALECHLEGEGEGAAETTFFWFDLFVNNQWAALDRDFDWWATTFRTAIQEIGKTVLVLLPWHAPIPLTRVWCLFEIYCSSNLAVALSRTQQAAFRDQIRTDGDGKGIQLALSKIDLEKATSFLPQDRERIFAAVRQVEAEGGGFSSFNRRVLQMLRDWIAETARGMVSENADAADDDAEQCADMVRVANLLEKQGKLDEAKELYDRALKGQEEQLGPRHPDTLLTVNNLANVLAEQGKMDEAKALYERALTGREEVLGSSHPDTLKTVGNLAFLLADQGKLDEAKVLYERALKGQEEKLGPSHPSTLMTVNNLANLLADQGKLDETKVLYERALKGYEEQLGPSHPDTLGTVNNLAFLLADQGELDEAKVLYERALKGKEEQLGPSHASTLRTVDNLAYVLMEQGKLDEAKALYERALRGRERQLGPNHSDTLETFNNIATLLFQQGELDEAKALYERALQGQEEQLGPRHPETLRTVNNLCCLLSQQGAPEEAAGLWEGSLRACAQDPASMGPARAMLEGLVRECERTKGAEHADTLLTRHNLARLLALPLPLPLE